MVLIVRVGLLTSLAAILALAALSLLAGRAADSGLEELEVGRLRFLVTSLRSTVEANLGLGLPIEDLDRLQAVIERDRTIETDIRAIEIVGPLDVTLYSTDRGAIGEEIPRAWQEAIEERHSSIWLAEDRGEFAIGEVVETDFGQAIGHVVLVVSHDQVHQPLGLSIGLASLGWLAMLAGAPLAFGLGVAIVALRKIPLDRSAAVWRGAWDDARAEGADNEKLPSLYGASLRARRTTEAANRRLERVRRGLIELDHAD